MQCLRCFYLSLTCSQGQQSLTRNDQHVIRITGKPGFTGTKLDIKPGSEVIKLFSCSTQLSMKFSLLINMKMPTVVGIFIFITEKFLCSTMFSKK